jgi:hypothetical protein
MASTDRSAIANAIWLCGNCHKLIDDDPDRYPPGLLFEWQRDHERRVGEAVGKAGAELRKRYEERHLEEFGKLSYLAERIILEKGDFWEYRLTTEVLRFEMNPVLSRWDALKRGLYTKSSCRVARLETIPWVLDRLAEIRRIAHAFGALMNTEFDRAWGAPGVPGNDVEIISVCRLFAEMCGSAITWEETVRFVTVDHIFDELRDLFVGVAGGLIDEAAKVPAFLAENIGDSPKPGKYRLMLTLSLPEGWNDSVESALERSTNAILSEL